MANKVTINITSPDPHSATAAQAETPPSPLSMDTIGPPAATPRRAGGETSGQAPTPLPLDQLLRDFPRRDPALPEPSLLADLSPGDGGAPSPLPLDDLQPGRPPAGG